MLKANAQTPRAGVRAKRAALQSSACAIGIAISIAILLDERTLPRHAVAFWASIALCAGAGLELALKRGPRRVTQLTVGTGLGMAAASTFTMGGLAYVVLGPIMFVFLVRWAWTRPHPAARFLYGLSAGWSGSAVLWTAVWLAFRYQYLLIFQTPIIIGAVSLVAWKVPIRERYREKPEGAWGMACAGVIVAALIVTLKATR